MVRATTLTGRKSCQLPRALVMVRPASGLMALAEKMGPALAAAGV